MLYKNHTDQELRQLAMDVYDGKVFTDALIDAPNVTILGMIFLPIGLGVLAQYDLEELKANPPAMFYEYYDKAGPRSVNGYPSFFSFQMLNTFQMEKFIPFFNEYKNLKEGFLKTPA